MAAHLIITDIDGCISPEESIPWNLDLFVRFARICREANAGTGSIAPITLCTGRPQPYAEALAKILGIHAPIICENGAVLYTLDDNRSRFGPGVTEEKILGLRAVREFIDTALLPDYPGLIYQFGKEAQISVFTEHPEIFPEIEAAIGDFIADMGHPPLVIAPSHYYLNISMTGVDKGSTLEALFGEFGVTREMVAGIGDTEGDLPLRNATGFFACPANAKPVLKAAADYVSPYPDIEGLLDILARPEMKRFRS
ncbi:MAG TPA: HAD hydrolase family protein [Candidatus Hydrogenedentes bacterium]|nr:HAD hydrolase family protein [Candidatus Hydrogenedentota bacterium]HOT51948.1 HAD hydrolase family protein [Candidatus Hydrogenedentota bacterium]HOV76040.1 HAD hydrolase family protein [Candidatus Hydrogenedentota bacterium]HPC18230.1 HAD hydrolase family protein [Candidatus Hydrogenedentota bacterium]HRT21902.1 HAD hydrolase family protein [Candidatus Hydrogenedentota bacterium]